MPLVVIPNDLSALATGDEPANLIDANFSALATAINGQLDVFNVPDLANKQPSLGVPASDGMILAGYVNGTWAWVSPPVSPGTLGTMTNVQTFTASGTWTKPVGITAVMVEIWGAGGANNGGSGGYGISFFTVTTNITVTVGAGTSGTGGASTVSSTDLPSGLLASGGVSGSGGAGGTVSGFLIALTGNSGVSGGALPPREDTANPLRGKGGATSANGNDGLVVIRW